MRHETTFEAWRREKELTRVLGDALGIAAVDCERARNMLYGLMARFDDDHRVWWALANITDRDDERHMALHEVLRLKPDHRQACEILDLLNAHLEL